MKNENKNKKLVSAMLTKFFFSNSPLLVMELQIYLLTNIQLSLSLSLSQKRLILYYYYYRYILSAPNRFN